MKIRIPVTQPGFHDISWNVTRTGFDHCSPLAKFEKSQFSHSGRPTRRGGDHDAVLKRTKEKHGDVGRNGRLGLHPRWIKKHANFQQEWWPLFVNHNLCKFEGTKSFIFHVGHVCTQIAKSDSFGKSSQSDFDINWRCSRCSPKSGHQTNQFES